MRSLIRAVVLASSLSLGSGLCGSVRVQADEVPDEDPAASRSTSFQAVEGPTREHVPGAPLLVGAYGTVLVVLLSYVLWLGRLQTGSAREIERLRAAIAQSASAPEGSRRESSGG